MRESQSQGMEEGSLTGLVEIVRRRWMLVLGVPVLLSSGLLAFHLLGPQQFEASVTLSVIPSKFRSELDPEELSVYGYQRLLESDVVVNETERRMREEGLVEEESELRLGRDIRSQIFMARRLETTALTDLVEVVGMSSDAVVAARFANEWATVLLEVVDEMASRATTATVSFLESQYPEAATALAALEDQLLEVRKEYQRRQDQARRSWATRISRAETDGLNATASYQIETRAQLEELVERSLGEIEPLAVAAGEGESLSQLFRQLGSVRTELAQVPPVVDLERSISDDTLRMAGMAAGADAGGTLSLDPLVDQEINEFYEVLAERASGLESELRSVAPEVVAAALRASMQLDQLARIRASGLEALRIELELERRNLERRRDSELETISWEGETELGHMRTKIALQRGLTSKLGPAFNEARLERSQAESQDVFLVGGLVDRGKPRPSDLLRSLYLAAFGGLLLGLLLALVIELSRASTLSNPS